MKPEDPTQRAAEAVAQAEAILIGAGAGMGVDSGLPDFRGPQGFWKAYPAYANRRLNFIDLANPDWFDSDPSFAWGFYGHRLNLYRTTRPHAGFDILKRWLESKPVGGFVFTSNVDGQFQRAGFVDERIVECHGSIDRLQCLRECGIGIFSADPFELKIDEATMRAAEPLPSCPNCGALARPNVLMFGDWKWDSSRTLRQDRRFDKWLDSIRGTRGVVVECGAGTAIPSVRVMCEDVARRFGGTLVRINPREPDVPSGQIGIALGARAALEQIDQSLSTSGEAR